MNICFLVLLLVLLPGLACLSADQRYFCDMSSGKFSVNFNCGGEGISAYYGGVRIVRNSSMWVHNPAWNYHYYGLNAMKDPVKVSEIEGGKEAIITHRSEAFEGTQRVRVTENKLTIELKCKLLKDVKDADLEYGFGTICAAPILGRPYSAVTEKGERVAGTVPVRATSRDSWSQQLTPDPFTKLQIDSRIGKLSFDVSGDPGTLIMMDYRMNVYQQPSDTPVFWCGRGFHLEYGKEYCHVVTISVDPVSGSPLHSGPETLVIDAKPVERKDLRVSQYGPVHVIPEPQQMKLTDEVFRLTPETRIVVADSAAPEDMRGAQSFADEVKLLYGFAPKVVREEILRQAQDAKAGCIYVGESANKLLADAAKAEKLVTPDREEGYALTVTRKRVLVLGHDRQGSYYGMQTLKQLVRADTKGIGIHGCEISDWPSLKFRGLHIFTGNKALAFHSKLIDRILSRYKMNNIVLEADFVKWKTDPAIAPAWAQEQADVKKEIEYAREHFIEVNPLVQSLGHCDWLFQNGKNLDIAETPAQPYAYCPTNPRTYDYVLKFYDEAVELFGRPKYFHIGHDEVTEPGGFPKHDECKKRSPEQIFVDDTLKVREHLAKSGARVMMWGDMMLARGDSPDATNAKDAQTAKWIRDQLPKDVVVTDWHYQPSEPEKYKSLKLFMDEGHDTIAATWYTPANIEAFANQAKAVGAMGLLQTTWPGFESSETNLKSYFEQFSAIILAAEYAWNSGKTSLDELPYNWDEEFRKQWDPRPVDVQGRRGFALDIGGAGNVNLADNDAKSGWLGLGPQTDLSALETGEVRLKGDLYKIGTSVLRLASAIDLDRAYPAAAKINVNRKSKSLLFLHTCAWTDRANRKVGSYRISYADGTSESIELVYGFNIVSWIDQSSISGAEKVWSGRAKDGQKIPLMRLEWTNPHPEKEIASIEVVSAATEAGPVLLAVSGLE